MQLLVAVCEVSERLIQRPQKQASPAGEARVHRLRVVSDADKPDLILVERGPRKRLRARARAS